VAAGWEKILDRYRVETVIVDKLKRGVLIGRLRNNRTWTVVFEDPVAIIFARQESPGGS
jgi:hypothetical protein